jgi:2-haloacid dehalogenase
MLTKRSLFGVRAYVFDAYGTLFDVSSAARQVQSIVGDKWERLAEIWRTKQLQYTWLRSLMGRYADFWQITGEALDFAMDSINLRDTPLRDRLMELYLRLNAYPEVPEVLARLNTQGIKCAVLSNGSPMMLSAAVVNAGVTNFLDPVLSVEEVKVFKPHPSVYQLALDRLCLKREEICFVSSNGWDAFAAKAFGFQVIWCNRLSQALERIPEVPDGQIRSLSELPEILGAV